MHNFQDLNILHRMHNFPDSNILRRMWANFSVRKFSRLEYFVEHHLIKRSNGVQWLWWLQWAKEQCHWLGHSSKPTKQGDGRAWRRGRGGAEKMGRWPGYSTRPKSSKESWPEALAEQARSLGQKHWPSKQGVSARSSGRASKESWLEALAKQARSLNRIHWLSNEQELRFGSFLFWIFSSYQVKIQQYVGTRTQ